MLTKLSALFHVTAENWLEVDFSHWGKRAYDSSKFEQLKTAVIQCREVTIVYESSGSGRSTRIVQPLKICYKSKEWYLKAFCTKKQDFRIFKLNRIVELEPSENTFVPKPYPEEKNDFQQDFPQIVLLFSKETAYRVYDEFDKTEMELQENGDLLVRTEMPVDPWLIGYLLSFGTQVEIVAPDGLRNMLAAQAQEIYRKHKP